MRTKIQLTPNRISRFKEAQITSEYAILVTAIAVALVAMQIYIKRGLSARLKDAADYPINVSGTNFTTGQYEPDYYYSDSLTEQTETREASMEEGGVTVDSTIISSINMTEIINGTQ